jgi:hypothetical protein
MSGPHKSNNFCAFKSKLLNFPTLVFLQISYTFKYVLKLEIEMGENIIIIAQHEPLLRPFEIQ